jgi:hypothetical protein
MHKLLTAVMTVAVFAFRGVAGAQIAPPPPQLLAVSQAAKEMGINPMLQGGPQPGQASAYQAEAKLDLSLHPLWWSVEGESVTHRKVEGHLIVLAPGFVLAESGSVITIRPGETSEGWVGVIFDDTHGGVWSTAFYAKINP